MLRQRALFVVPACLMNACGSDPLIVSGHQAATGGVTGTGGGTGAGSGGGAGAGACVPNQSILTGAVINARDLGGTPLEAGGAVACNKVYRGPPLAYLSAEGCADFAGLGIRSVIDLRTPDERISKPDSACVTEATNLVFSPLPIPYNVSPQDYIADLDATLSMAEALRVLGDEAAYPVYFHCTWGRDRTGVLSAVILLALGAQRDAILQEYLLSSSSVGAYPDSLLAVLDEIERRGGIEAYFTAAGISEEQLATLRAQAIAP